MEMQLWGPEFELVGISSGSWYRGLLQMEKGDKGSTLTRMGVSG